MVSFRNHDNVKMEFGPDVNVVWGPNGAGKTSVLEGIHLLSVGKSFRTSRSRELIKSGDDYFSVTGQFNEGQKETTVQFNQMKSGERRFKVNGKKLNRIQDLVGMNPVVILSPEEQIITKGSPGDRRGYFNRVFSVIFHDYLENLSEYQRILKQRNSLLQNLDSHSADTEELRAWDKSIAESGLTLWTDRHIHLKAFQEELEQVTKQYADDLTLKMRYPKNPVDSVEAYLLKLQQNKNRDSVLGLTTFGPHRDRIDFMFNRRSLRDYGSQGEQKLALILIKIAEFALIKNQTGKTPTLLLDDLFAKLDFNRSGHILDLLNSGIQSIITTTDLVDMENHGMNIHQDDLVTIKLG